MTEQRESQGADGGASFTERIEVTGQQIVSKIQELVREGNVRRVTIRSKEGRDLFSIPLNAGVVVGGVAVVAAPTLAAIAAVAALLSSATLIVERTDAGPGTDGTTTEGHVVDIHTEE